MFGHYKMDAYICGGSDPYQPTPSQVLSDYLGRDVHLVMKGPTRRISPPTTAFPELEANVDFQVRYIGLVDHEDANMQGHQDGYPILVASVESLNAVENAIRRAASRGPTEGGKIPGIDRGRWHDGELEMERYVTNGILIARPR